MLAITMPSAVAAIAAGLAILGGGLATAMAQAAIGSAGIGLIAENPKQLGTALLFLVLPETILIFGFIIAVLILLGAGLL
ncbi:MAG: ATPase [Candidatus Micrarchaeia archaeon]